MNVTPKDLLILMLLWLASAAAVTVGMHELHSKLLADYQNVTAKIKDLPAKPLNLPPPALIDAELDHPQFVMPTLTPAAAPPPAQTPYCNELRQQYDFDNANNEQADARATQSTMTNQGCQ